MILFIDACVRTDSRTRRLAEACLEMKNGSIVRRVLPDTAFPKIDDAFIRTREERVRLNDYSLPVFGLAKEFCSADEIVIAAPFWDLSFPSLLKVYLEQVTVPGITFVYGEDGVPRGLCRAKKLTYLTTAGGPAFGDPFGFGYVKALAEQYYGIRDFDHFLAEGLDIEGADTERILQDTIRAIREKG